MPRTETLGLRRHARQLSAEKSREPPEAASGSGAGHALRATGACHAIYVVG